MLTLKQIIKHIKKCKKRGVKFNFLGLVENKDLSPEVEDLFRVTGLYVSGWDWVNGNDSLKELINTL